MATNTIPEQGELGNSRSRQSVKDNDRSKVTDNSYLRTVETEPRVYSSTIVGVGSIVPLGLAGAALALSLYDKRERVAVTAWISVAIVGTAAVISSAAVAHRRSVSVNRDNNGALSSERRRSNLRQPRG